MEPQSQHSDLGFLKLMQVSFGLSYSPTKAEIKLVLFGCFFFPVAHGALTLPISSPSYYILLVVLVSPGPARIDQVSCCNDFRR